MIKFFDIHPYLATFIATLTVAVISLFGIGLSSFLEKRNKRFLDRIEFHKKYLIIPVLEFIENELKLVQHLYAGIIEGKIKVGSGTLSDLINERKFAAYTMTKEYIDRVMALYGNHVKNLCFINALLCITFEKRFNRP